MITQKSEETPTIVSYNIFLSTFLGGIGKTFFYFKNKIQTSFIPKVNPGDLCEAWKLCSVRKRGDEDMVAVKYIDGTSKEIPLREVVNADEYEGLKIVRTYASGCVFIDETLTQTFLVAVEKEGNRQYQYTGGSPIEEEYANVISKNGDKLRVNLEKIEDNAVIRTLKRTGAEPTEFYNHMPLVDRVMQENTDEADQRFRRMVLLLHYVVKSYTGVLSFNSGIENVADGQRFSIESLSNMDGVAPNAYLIAKRAVEEIKKI